MFTGLVQAVGRLHTVALIDPAAPAGARRLLIDPAPWTYTPAPGDSIAVNGVCLTLAAPPSIPAATRPGLWAFDAIPETLAKTTLGRLTPGSPVNLEHALTASTLMGGHFVQGHVDAAAPVTAVARGSDYRLTIRPPAHLMPAMTPQGSVTIDGVSLTLAHVTDDTITVALIPTTLEKTTLATLNPGDEVNIEADMLVKAVLNAMEKLTAHSSKLK